MNCLEGAHLDFNNIYEAEDLRIKKSVRHCRNNMSNAF